MNIASRRQRSGGWKQSIWKLNGTKWLAPWTLMMLRAQGKTPLTRKCLPGFVRQDDHCELRMRGNAQGMRAELLARARSHHGQSVLVPLIQNYETFLHRQHAANVMATTYESRLRQLINIVSAMDETEQQSFALTAEEQALLGLSTPLPSFDTIQQHVRRRHQQSADQNKQRLQRRFFGGADIPTPEQSAPPPPPQPTPPPPPPPKQRQSPVVDLRPPQPTPPPPPQPTPPPPPPKQRQSPVVDLLPPIPPPTENERSTFSSEERKFINDQLFLPQSP